MKFNVLCRVLFALCFISIHSAMAQMPYSINQDYFVEVAGSNSWTHSGVYINQGERIIILSKGLSSGWANPQDWWRWYGGEGLLVEPGVPDSHPMPGHPGGCLLGKIGTGGDLFYVGPFMAMEAPYAGELYFGPNDYQPGDNPGVFYVFIWKLYPTDVPGPGAGQTSFLQQNYPNPFNPPTKIEYYVGEEGHVNVRVYNANGRLVRTLVDERKAPGEYGTQWQGKDDHGFDVASGTYFVEMSLNGSRSSRSVVLVK